MLPIEPILNRLEDWDLLIAVDFIFILLSVKYARVKLMRILLIITFAVLGIVIIAAKAITSIQGV